MRKATKYRAVRTEYDGHSFQSKREAKRWAELRLMEKAGQITDLVRQVSFPIEINGQRVCSYTADFVYREVKPVGRWGKFPTVVEDCKGFRTPIYSLKAKLMKAVLGIEIRET